MQRAEAKPLSKPKDYMDSAVHQSNQFELCKTQVVRKVVNGS